MQKHTKKRFFFSRIAKEKKRTFEKILTLSKFLVFRMIKPRNFLFLFFENECPPPELSSQKMNIVAVFLSFHFAPTRIVHNFSFSLSLSAPPPYPFALWFSFHWNCVFFYYARDDVQSRKETWEIWNKTKKMRTRTCVLKTTTPTFCLLLLLLFIIFEIGESFFKMETTLSHVRGRGVTLWQIAAETKESIKKKEFKRRQ